MIVKLFELVDTVFEEFYTRLFKYIAPSDEEIVMNYQSSTMYRFVYGAAPRRPPVYKPWMANLWPVYLTLDINKPYFAQASEEFKEAYKAAERGDHAKLEQFLALYELTLD